MTPLTFGSNGRPALDSKTKHSNHKKRRLFFFIVIFPFVRHIINNPQHNQYILSNSYFFDEESSLFFSLFEENFSIRVSYTRHEKLYVFVLRQCCRESFVTFYRFSFHLVEFHQLDGCCVLSYGKKAHAISNMHRRIKYSIFY